MNLPKNIICLFCFLIVFAANTPAQEKTEPEPPDAVARKYKPEIDRLKADYEARLKAIRLRMIAEYDAAIDSSLGAKDLETANALKARMEALKNLTSPELRIVGRWNIVHGAKTDVWKINKDHTYNYGNDTGKWSYSGGKYLLKHTWDWELQLDDENTFEGVCVRGESGTKVRGTRTEN